MIKLVLAAMLMCAPVLAAPLVPQAPNPVNGTISATSTAVGMTIDGGLYNTVRFYVSGTFSATLVPEVTFDGVFYDTTSTPFIVETDILSATPTSTRSITTTGTWELLIPSNAQGAQLRASAYTSGTATVRILPGRLYYPGQHLSATLYDSLGYVASSTLYSYNMAGWDSGSWMVQPSTTSTYPTYMKISSGTAAAGSVFSEIDFMEASVPLANATSTWSAVLSRQPPTSVSYTSPGTYTGTPMILFGAVPMFGTEVLVFDHLNATSTARGRILVNR